MDQKHIIDDCVTIDGTYGDFIDPFAFRAATKGNNPDVLSHDQMLWQDGHEDFLKTEVPKLQGLDGFGDLEYLKNIRHFTCKPQKFTEYDSVVLI